MRTSRVERLEGHVLALGLVYEAERLGTGERDEILSHWLPGSALLVQGRWLVHRFPKARRVAVRGAWGAPVVETPGGGIATFRGPAHEHSEANLSWLEGGEVHSVPLSASKLVSPADWFELDFVVEQGESVEAPVPEPALVATPKTDVRQLLGNVVGAPPAEQALVLEGLRSRNAEKQRPRRSVTTRLVRATRSAFQLLGRIIDSFRSRRGTAVTRGTKTAARRQSFFERFSNRAKKWLWESRLGALLGRQHAKYLEEVFGLFERGDFEEALRRALPTTNTPGSGEMSFRLAPPTPRTDLTLGSKSGGGSGVTLAESLFTSLRETYRRALTELKRRGEHHRAAFVLAELLDEPSEAVDYLESVGLVREAAELAEARNLPSERLVRQWLIARDRKRAIEIAVRDGAFEAAVARLGSRPEVRTELRLLWANHCADAGDYLKAARVLYDERDAARLVRTFLQKASDQGGDEGSEALCELLAKYPDLTEHYWARARAIFEDESSTFAPLRLHAAKFLDENQSSRPGALARLAVRALLRDHGEARSAVPVELPRRLALASGDGALHVDLPTLELASIARSHLTLEFPQTTRSGPKWAEFLSSGKLLVARGENGLEIHGNGGRLVRRFEVPCEHFVLSTNETRAITLIRRGETTVLHRIELDSGRADRWGELAVECVAETFDGAVLYVSVRGRIHALDARAPSPTSSLWISAPVEGRVWSISSNAQGLRYIAVNQAGAEAWLHSPRPHRLLRRIPHEIGSFVNVTERKLELSDEDDGEVLRCGEKSLRVADSRDAVSSVEWSASEDPRYLVRRDTDELSLETRETVIDLDQFRIATDISLAESQSASPIRNDRRTWLDRSGNVYWVDLARRLLLERRSVL